jgi:hypothetical protein
MGSADAGDGRAVTADGSTVATRCTPYLAPGRGSVAGTSRTLDVELGSGALAFMPAGVGFNDGAGATR